MLQLEENDPALKSFLEISPNSDFSIQNLPLGVFIPAKGASPRLGIAIGEYVLDLSVLAKEKFFSSEYIKDITIFSTSNLNVFIAQGQPAWRHVRQTVSHLLRAEESTLRDNTALRKQAFHLQSVVQLLLPIEVKGYTDFYSSKEHATNLGRMFRPNEEPLSPNWLHMPIGYDGRAGSIVVSGTDFHRPQGQRLPAGETQPAFSATQALDCELELGAIVGKTNPLGQPISMKEAPDYLFGVVLLNDWSARDIQKWEYQPLGPFLGKNFCTSISPWVVMFDALHPFRVKGPEQTPKPLSYLQSNEDWALNITLEMAYQTPKMKALHVIAKTNARYLYWNFCQQLVHHAVNGCSMRVGDLLGTGTISGSEPGSYGSLIELSWGGKQPIQLPNDEQRCFLEDGDSIILSGFSQGSGYRVGFGEVRGTVLGSL